MLTNFIFMGVLLILSAFAISMSLPFESEWGKRDRAMIALLAGGSIMASLGIFGSIMQYFLKVFL